MGGRPGPHDNGPRRAGARAGRSPGSTRQAGLTGPALTTLGAAVDPRRESTNRRDRAVRRRSNLPGISQANGPSGRGNAGGEPTAGETQPNARRPLMPESRPSLSVLEQHDAFVGRHLGLTAADREVMLGVVGAPTLDA